MHDVPQIAQIAALVSIPLIVAIGAMSLAGKHTAVLILLIVLALDILLLWGTLTN